MSKKEISLFPYQTSHCHTLDFILDQHPMAIDTSPMGRGKTYVASALSKQRGMQMFIIAPKTALTTWNRVMDEYNISCIELINFQSLRGTKTSKPKHGYLDFSSQDSDDEDEPEFIITKKCKNAFSTPTLIVIDEVQHIKNDTSQSRACRALAVGALQTHPLNRLLLLSATPFDKHEHVINILRLGNYISTGSLSHKEGIESVMKFSESVKKFDPIRVEQIMNEVIFKNITNTCYKLFVDVLNPHISSSMSGEEMEVKNDIKNGYFPLTSTEEKKKLEEAIASLANAAGFDAKGNQDRSQMKWGMITNVLMNIETCKVDLLFRCSMQSLKQKNVKVVLFVNFLSTVQILEERLNAYHPVVLTGKLSQEKRKEVIEDFQENPCCRVIIAITQLGVGIDLDDKVGDSPRHCYIVPSYSLINLHQATGRVYRQKTKSTPVIRFVYGHLGNKKEVSILNALTKKSNVVKEVTQSSMMLPDDYEDEIVDI